MTANVSRITAITRATIVTFSQMGLVLKRLMQSLGLFSWQLKSKSPTEPSVVPPCVFVIRRHYNRMVIKSTRNAFTCGVNMLPRVSPSAANIIPP